jgi:hypothetical protein
MTPQTGVDERAVVIVERGHIEAVVDAAFTALVEPAFVWRAAVRGSGKSMASAIKTGRTAPMHSWPLKAP